MCNLNSGQWRNRIKVRLDNRQIFILKQMKIQLNEGRRHIKLFLIHKVFLQFLCYCNSLAGHGYKQLLTLLLSCATNGSSSPCPLSPCNRRSNVLPALSVEFNRGLPIGFSSIMEHRSAFELFFSTTLAEEIFSVTVEVVTVFSSLPLALSCGSRLVRTEADGAAGAGGFFTSSSIAVSVRPGGRETHLYLQVLVVYVVGFCLLRFSTETQLHAQC